MLRTFLLIAQGSRPAAIGVGMRKVAVPTCPHDRELANTHIAACSAAIGEEEQNADPNQVEIERLRKASLAIALERRSLSMTDAGAVARFVDKYRR